MSPADISYAVRCRECGNRMMVMEGRGNRAHVRAGAVIRGKQCESCGHEEYTAESVVDLSSVPHRKRAPRRARVRSVNECGHPEREHRALGMCRPCYYRYYRVVRARLDALRGAA